MKKNIFYSIIFLFISINLFGLTESDIKITKGDITNSGGKIIDGEYPVSIQAGSLYSQFEQKLMKEILPMPVKQSFVSALYGDDKSTIYYYEFENRESADKAINFIKPFIWGESGPTQMHPERIYQLDNYIIIISSLKPNKLDALTKEKVFYLPVPENVITNIIKRTKCDKKGKVDPCALLKEFNTKNTEKIKPGKPYFGYAWEINKDGEITKTFFEVLEIREKDGKYFGHWFPLKPENKEEEAQITEITDNAKSGGKIALPPDLKSFLDSVFDKSNMELATKKDNVYFLEAGGNIAQLKQLKDKIILLVATEHWTGKPGSIILAVFWTKF